LAKKIVVLTGAAAQIEINNNDEVTEKKSQIQQDSEDLIELMERIKEKIASVSYHEKVQYLTLVPASWTLTKILKFFPSVTEHLVRTSRKLLKTEGILSKPEKRTGKNLSEEVIDAVENIYQDDEFSRQLPGLI
jgi:predicted transcriptional regulator